VSGPSEPGGDTVAWRSRLELARQRLAEAGFPSPDSDARRIVEEASGLAGADWVVGLDRPATRRGVVHFDQMLDRRLAGEPLQYVLGSWGFRTLDLMVDARVLIPRPETETVVEHALDELDRLRSDTGRRELRVLDLGTGSGAIALSLAAERDGLEVWATDVSDDALDVARANLAGLGMRGGAVRLAQGSWFDAVPTELAGTLDLVISNPPYVARSDPLPAEVADWEPPEALVAGPTGTEWLHHLVVEAPRWLARPGVLVLELAPHQGDPLAAAAQRAGFDQVVVRQDLSGRVRALVARAVR
jgi:release factor glutamine methyltransferase